MSEDLFIEVFVVYGGVCMGVVCVVCMVDYGGVCSVLCICGVCV